MLDLAHLRTLSLLSCIALTAVACNDDEDDLAPCEVSAGTLSGGPFAFTLDGLPDNVTDITLDGAAGDLMAYLITDDAGQILGIQPTLDGLTGVNFDPNAAGTCQIYHMSFQRGVLLADVGENIADITGCFELSNAIDVVRTPCGAVGGTLDSASFEFEVDEDADFIAEGDLQLSGAEGDSTNFVLTSADSVIVALFADASALASVDLSTFGAGDYLVWALTRNSRLENAAPGTPATDVVGCFALSNPVSVSIGCPASGGSLEGGPFVFSIDGEEDFLGDDELTLTGSVGDTMTYVVTDDAGVILGLPGDYAGLQTVNFDGAGTGRCLIWHLSYNGPLTGAAVGENANDLQGCFSLSNPIIVERVCEASGGRLSGSGFEIVVDSVAQSEGGLVDTIDTTLLVLSGAEGEGSTYVVTDADANILALPADLEALGQYSFDGAGTGTALIWHLSFNGEITGADVGANATSIQGCHDLSNSVEVMRRDP